MLETLGAVTAGIAFFSIFVTGIAVIGSYFEGRRKAPKLAGTTIPEIGEGLDIAKRYDIVYSGGDFGGHFVERLHGVRIVGYVGRDDDGSVSKMYLRGRWLVVEFADGRRAYLMPHAIVSLQESAPAAT